LPTSRRWANPVGVCVPDAPYTHSSIQVARFGHGARADFPAVENGAFQRFHFSDIHSWGSVLALAPRCRFRIFAFREGGREHNRSHPLAAPFPHPPSPCGPRAPPSADFVAFLHDSPQIRGGTGGRAPVNREHHGPPPPNYARPRVPESAAGLTP
jgi:hypothetical protein